MALAAAWPTRNCGGANPHRTAWRTHGRRIARLARHGRYTAGRHRGDPVVAVNVIEHTTDPVRFLRDLRRAGAPDAMLWCLSERAQPGVELLIADHSSLSLRRTCSTLRRAGLRVRASGTGPAGDRPFQMTAAWALMTRNGSRPSRSSTPRADDLNGHRNGSCAMGGAR